MTAEELEKIVVRHEMQCLELKESFNIECIETACAFANMHGGFIVIGVDNDGNPSKHQLRFEGLRDYENKISTATEPSVAVDAEKVEFRGREVVVLKVIENPLKPVAYKGRCFVRKGSVNHQMTPVEIAECHIKSTGGSMDSMFVDGVGKNDLDMDAVREYMKASKEAGRRDFAIDDDPWSVLIKLQFVKSETEITRAAYLLFAKEPQVKFPQAIVHAGAFRDEGALILDGCDIAGNIQNQIETTLAFIKRNIRRSIVVTGKAAHDRYWEYPIEALRETITNAICHRDYNIPNDIQIKIMEDCIVVFSPGLLPLGMEMEMLTEPNHPSCPRNKLIAQAFYDLHLIEHYGSGIRRIERECAKNGNAVPKWEQKCGFFVTTYHPRETGQTSSNVIAPSDGAINGAANGAVKLPDVQQRIIGAIKAYPGINAGKLATELDLGTSTIDRGVRYLKNLNLIEFRGSRKTGGYYCK